MSNEISFYRFSAGDVLQEEWLLFPATRHNIEGYRVNRYVRASALLADVLASNPDDKIKAQAIKVYSKPNKMTWDDRYMFFLTLDAAHKAFNDKELEEGRRAY